MATNKYFGVEFEDKFPLDDQLRRLLAMLLFANFETSPEEAYRIIRTVDRWSSMDQLFSPLKNEMYKVTNIGLKELKIPEIMERFQNKYFLWLRTFSCPTSKEVTEIARLYKNLPHPIFQQLIVKAISNVNMPANRIIEFLSEFSLIITQKNTDLLLDLLSKKINEERQYRSSKINHSLNMLSNHE